MSSSLVSGRRLSLSLYCRGCVKAFKRDTVPGRSATRCVAPPRATQKYPTSDCRPTYACRRSSLPRRCLPVKGLATLFLELQQGSFRHPVPWLQIATLLPKRGSTSWRGAKRQNVATYPGILQQTPIFAAESLVIASNDPILRQIGRRCHKPRDFATNTGDCGKISRFVVELANVATNE